MKKVAVFILLFVTCGCAEQTTEDIISTGDVAEISTISVYSVGRNWDADAEDDGIVININFYNRDHEIIYFKEHEFYVTIRIYTTVYDENFNAQKGRLVYENTFEMTSSIQIDDFWGKGLEIPFTEIKTRADDDQFGIMEVTVEIPGVGMYYGVDEFTQLYP